jgi:FKBP12-rapamycin complex-associated protein
MELTDQYQDSLIRALQTSIRSNTIPPEILQTLLNLAEFMEHDVEALPIPLSILADLAQKSHAYAKALHYRELEFQSHPTASFENLINVNKKLDQYDAAVGVMKAVAKMKIHDSSDMLAAKIQAKVRLRFVIPFTHILIFHSKNT